MTIDEFLAASRAAKRNVAYIAEAHPRSAGGGGAASLERSTQDPPARLCGFPWWERTGLSAMAKDALEKRDQQLRGKLSESKRPDGEPYMIAFHGHGPVPVAEVPLMQLVLTVGLRTERMNGLRGLLEQWHPGEGRFAVRLEDGTTRLLRPQNLTDPDDSSGNEEVKSRSCGSLAIDFCGGCMCHRAVQRWPGGPTVLRLAWSLPARWLTAVAARLHGCQANG